MSEQSATLSPVSGQSGSGLIALGVGAVGVVISLVVILGALFTEGHATYNTTSTLVWGFPVAVYVTFVLASTGLTFVAALGMILGIKSFLPIAKRCVWLALATLLAGLMTLAMEIGDPIKMIWALPFSFQTASAMWWMGVFYGLDLIFLAVKFQRMNSGDWDSGTSKGLGVAGLISVILAGTCLGLVFGMMAMRPVWYGGSVPLYFLTTAAVSGVAIIIIALVASYGSEKESMPAHIRPLFEGPLPAIFTGLMGVLLVFVAARTITGLWSNVEGLEAFNGWITATATFHIGFWACLVLPFVVLLLPEMRAKPMVLAGMSLLALIGILIARYEYIVGGQVVPLFQGTRYPGFVPYTPSMTEWMTLVFAVSATLLLYGIGQKFLDLDARKNG